MLKMLTAIGLALAVCSGPALAAKAKPSKQPAAHAKQLSDPRTPVAPRRVAPPTWSQTCSWDNPCPSRNLY